MRSFKTVYMRGGTSKGCMFHREDLPADEGEWNRIFLQVMGCPDPKQIEIGRHGLVLVLGRRQGVFLPQVPVEQKWDLGQYLTHLCYKAGLPDGSWKHPEAQLWWYEGLVFQVIK